VTADREALAKVIRDQISRKWQIDVSLGRRMDNAAEAAADAILASGWLASVKAEAAAGALEEAAHNLPHARTVKAKKLTPDMALLIRGKVWTVVSTKVKKRGVDLTLNGPGGFFRRVVDPDTRYEIQPLRVTDSGGAVAHQARWAKPAEADKALRPHSRPKTKPAGIGWDEDQAKADKRVRRQLGGELLAVKPEGSDAYFVPLTAADTLPAHLLIFHGVTLKGSGSAMSLADYQEAERIHEAQHRDYEAGQADLLVPHWHAKERPAA
jgi:hypothetical protein